MIRQEKFHGGRVFRLTAGEVSLVLAPEIGGRIVSLRQRDEELLFVPGDHTGAPANPAGAEDLRTEKQRRGFQIHGGDKTWIAPQAAWWEAMPPLDLDAGVYQARIEGDAVFMESPDCRETGLRILRRVELKSDGEILLDETAVNAGKSEVRRGIWNVTQCRRPMDVFLPAPAREVRPYPEEGDSPRFHRELVREEESWSVIPCREPAHFKFGCLARRGLMLAARKLESEKLLLLRSFDADPSAEHAHGSNLEIYNSPHFDYLELEAHAPIRTLKPGESMSLRQNWRLARAPLSETLRGHLARFDLTA